MKLIIKSFPEVVNIYLDSNLKHTNIMKHLVLLVCLVLWCLTYDFVKVTGDIPVVIVIGDILSLMIVSIMIKDKRHGI